MKKFLVLSACAVAMLAAAPAFAQDSGTAPAAAAAAAGGAMNGMFAKMDANGDGVVSKDEYLAAAGKRFDDMDANHDGKLTKDEVQSKFAAMKDKWMAKKQGGAAAPGATPAQ